MGNFAAASVAGDATAARPGYSVAAVSVLGDAWTPEAGRALSVLGQCNGQACEEVSLTDDADGYWLSASATGDATGPFAVSLLGDATCPGPSSSGFDCVAVAGFGHARSSIVAVSIFGNSESSCGPSGWCPSVSVMGTAQGGMAPTSACATAGAATDSDACMDPRDTIHLTLA